MQKRRQWDAQQLVTKPDSPRHGATSLCRSELYRGSGAAGDSDRLILRMVDRFFYLRIFVALLLVGFASFLGRSLARRHQRGRRGTGATSWGLRMVVATLGVTWGVGFDIVAIGAFALFRVSSMLGGIELDSTGEETT